VAAKSVYCESGVHVVEECDEENLYEMHVVDSMPKKSNEPKNFNKINELLSITLIYQSKNMLFYEVLCIVYETT
jgi:hypothetical protein